MTDVSYGPLNAPWNQTFEYGLLRGDTLDDTLFSKYTCNLEVGTAATRQKNTRIMAMYSKYLSDGLSLDVRSKLLSRWEQFARHMLPDEMLHHLDALKWSKELGVASRLSSYACIFEPKPVPKTKIQRTVQWLHVIYWQRQHHACVTKLHQTYAQADDWMQGAEPSFVQALCTSKYPQTVDSLALQLRHVYTWMLNYDPSHETSFPVVHPVWMGGFLLGSGFMDKEHPTAEYLKVKQRTMHSLDAWARNATLAKFQGLIAVLSHPDVAAQVKTLQTVWSNQPAPEPSSFLAYMTSLFPPELKVVLDIVQPERIDDVQGWANGVLGLATELPQLDLEETFDFNSDLDYVGD